MEEQSTLTKMILSPELSGVYISKSDLQAIAASCGYSLQLQERKRMLVEIFALVQGVDDFVRIIDAIEAFVHHKSNMYKSIAAEFPNSSETVNLFLKKIEDCLCELEKAKEEASLIA